MEKKEKQILYNGTSLESYLMIKNKLESNRIKYSESTKKNDSWFHFFLRLFFLGTGSYGMNREHIMHYSIYVETEDYQSASQLIKDIG